jgi:RimJ/RimL family protein N-acetyltransferase
VLTAAVAWAEAQVGLTRIWAYCDVDNPASGRVMEKAGLSFEGIRERFAVHPNISAEPRDCRCYGKQLGRVTS